MLLNLVGHSSQLLEIFILKTIIFELALNFVKLYIQPQNFKLIGGEVPALYKAITHSTPK